MATLSINEGAYRKEGYDFSSKKLVSGWDYTLPVAVELSDKSKEPAEMFQLTETKYSNGENSLP